MQVIRALKVMRVLLNVLNTLNLDGSVVQLVFSAYEVGHLRQRLEGLFTLYVRGHGIFTLSNLPDMDVVDVDYIFRVQVLNFMSKLLKVDVQRGALHQNSNAALDNGDSCEHHDD